MVSSAKGQFEDGTKLSTSITGSEEGKKEKREGEVTVLWTVVKEGLVKEEVKVGGTWDSQSISFKSIEE